MLDILYFILINLIIALILVCVNAYMYIPMWTKYFGDTPTCVAIINKFRRTHYIICAWIACAIFVTLITIVIVTKFYTT